MLAAANEEDDLMLPIAAGAAGAVLLALLALWYWGLAGCLFLCCPCLAWCFAGGDEEEGELVVYEVRRGDMPMITTEDALRIMSLGRAEAVGGSLAGNHPRQDAAAVEATTKAVPRKTTDTVDIHVGRVVAAHGEDGTVVMHRHTHPGVASMGGGHVSAGRRFKKVMPGWVVGGGDTAHKTAAVNGGSVVGAPQRSPALEGAEPCLDLLRPRAGNLTSEPFFLGRARGLPARAKRSLRRARASAAKAAREQQRSKASLAEMGAGSPMDQVDWGRRHHFTGELNGKLCAGPWIVRSGAFVWGRRVGRRTWRLHQ